MHVWLNNYNATALTSYNVSLISWNELFRVSTLWWIRCKYGKKWCHQNIPLENSNTCNIRVVSDTWQVDLSKGWFYRLYDRYCIPIWTTQLGNQHTENPQCLQHRAPRYPIPSEQSRNFNHRGAHNRFTFPPLKRSSSLFASKTTNTIIMRNTNRIYPTSRRKEGEVGWGMSEGTEALYLDLNPNTGDTVAARPSSNQIVDFSAEYRGLKLNEGWDFIIPQVHGAGHSMAGRIWPTASW